MQSGNVPQLILDIALNGLVVLVVGIGAESSGERMSVHKVPLASREDEGEPNVPHLRARRMRRPIFRVSLHLRAHVLYPIPSDTLECYGGTLLHTSASPTLQQWVWAH